MKVVIKKALKRFVSYPFIIYCAAIVLALVMAVEVDPATMTYVNEMLYSMPDNCKYFICICLAGVGMGGFIVSFFVIIFDLLFDVYVNLWKEFRDKHKS